MNKKYLYNNIMYNISNAVKSVLNEDIQRFDVTDYSDDDILVSSHDIDEITKTPKDKNELCKFIAEAIAKNPKNPYLLDINTSSITDMGGIFSTEEHEYNYKNGHTQLIYLNDFNEYFQDYDIKSLEIEEIDIHTWDMSNVTNLSYFSNSPCLTSIKFPKDIDTSNVTDMQGMFKNCTSLIELDLSNFDTSNVTDMSEMFSHCYRLGNLDISHLNMMNVETVESMFNSMDSLSSIKFPQTSSKLKKMGYLFYRCFRLKDIDLSNVDTSNVDDMRYMFCNCGSLKTVDLFVFNTEKVNSMAFMFADCRQLKTLDLSNFNTPNLRYLNAMFDGCLNLSYLNMNSFNTFKVFNMKEMFQNCAQLKHLQVNLELFRTDNVKTVDHMFAGCGNLQELDMSNFNLDPNSKRKDILVTTRLMISRCYQLKKLDISCFESDINGNFIDLLNTICKKGQLEEIIISSYIEDDVKRILKPIFWSKLTVI